MKEQHMWAVRGPRRLGCVCIIRRGSIDMAQEFHDASWKTLYRRGYRCVRVTVKEEVGR